MKLLRWTASVVVATLLVLAGLFLVRGTGIGGERSAAAVARAALEALGYEPVGEPDTELEADQALAWALERSRPGVGGVALARGEGGAVRWRVRFPEGGEARVTPGGVVWSVRRPVPVDPGPDLYPLVAQVVLRAAVRHLFGAESGWRWTWSQSWREGEHTWHRARFVEEESDLPRGWEARMEVELVGSAVVGMRRRVHVVGTDMGVVAGRAAELRSLRRVALVGLALAVLGVVVAGAEAVSFHDRMAPWWGVLVAVLAAVFGTLAGYDPLEWGLGAVVAAAAVAFAPHWQQRWPGRAQVGPAMGLLLAAVLLAAPSAVAALGGWLPFQRVFPADTSPIRLFAQPWFVALVEEPVLRGALPGLAAPFVGWWGGALAGGALGAVLHPVPAVPLAAAFGTELVLQAGLIVTARYAGVAAAILARGIVQSVLQRQAYPAGATWDIVAMAGLALGAVLIAWRARRP